MARRQVKHLRRKFVEHLRTHPLDAVLAVTAPTAVIAVAARLFGAWILDAAVIALVVFVTRPARARVRTCLRARGRRLGYTESPIVVAAQWIGCFIGALWDVFMLWFSDRRRAIARYENTCRIARLDPIPTVVNWRETNEGDEFVVAVHPGVGENSASLTGWAVNLQDAAGEWCRRVRIARLEQGGQCLVTFVYRDPLSVVRLGRPPIADVKTSDFRKSIEVGKDEHGKPVTITLWKRNLLVGGLPDMGKSTLEAQLVAHAALAANARIWFADAKAGIEASVWAHTCDRVAYDAPSAHTMILDLETHMDATLERVAASDSDQHQPTAADPATLFVVDELAELTPASQARLRRIMSLGRAASISVIAATQRPHNRIIDTNVRALFHAAIAFGCKDENESDLILGAGMAERGYDASKTHTPGEFFHVGAQSRPLRCKAYNFDRTTRHAVASRCPTRQHSTPVSTTGFAPPHFAPPEQETCLEESEGASPPTEAPSVPDEAPVEGPDLRGAPGQAKVYEAIRAAPNGLGWNEIVAATQVSGETVLKAIARLEGRWIRKELGRWKAVEPTEDVAA
jgi:hypothetical protein